MSGAQITRILLGVSGIAAGAIPLLVKIFAAPMPVPRDPAPDWIGYLVCAMFIFAGLMAIVNSFEGGTDDPNGDLPQTAPRNLRIAYKFTGAAIAISLAALITWVSIGPGPRHFSGVGSFGNFAVGDAFGRVVFGIGALMAWFIIGAMAMRALKSAKQGD